MKDRKLWELVLYTNAELLAGFWVVQKYGKGWDTLLFLLACFVLAILLGIFIVLEKIEWVGVDVFRPEKIEKRIIPNLNSPVMNTLTVQGVKVNSERMLAKALIDMRNSNFDVNMTETFWLNKIGNESRWQKLGGNGRSDFVKMLDRWEQTGAIRRETGQNKRVVGDWLKVRKIEQGYSPPPMSHSPAPKVQ